MLLVLHPLTDTRARQALMAMLAAMVVVLGLVGPVLAVSGPTSLLDPSVPATGRADKGVTVEVTYRNREGSAPNHVNVVVDGAARAMSAPASQTDWKKGVRFSATLSLDAGSYTISFEAADDRRFSDAIDGGTIVVAAAPVAAPAPTPAPTPAAPAPTPKPAPTAKPAPTPAAPAPTPEPAAAAPTPAVADPTPVAADPTPAAADPTPAVAAPTSSVPGPGTSRFDEELAAGGSVTVRPTPVSGDPGTTAGQPAPQRDAAGLSLSGSGDGSWERVVPTLVTTTGAVTLAMAFMLFGKRRRDGEPPADDDALATAAATGSGMVATAPLVAGVRAVAPAPMPADLEAGMPRWRRPSLLQARKADPLRTAQVDVHLTFDHGLVGPVAGLERRTIRYRLVRLLDRPDEVLGAEIGILDRDDEVQVLERAGAFWRVLCPDGGQGWVHRMTIGDVVVDNGSGDVDDGAVGNAFDRAVPGSFDAPARDPIEEDVLAAYLAAHSHTD